MLLDIQQIAGISQNCCFAQMTTIALRSQRVSLKRTLTQEGQCIISVYDMVHLKLKRTNQTTCHLCLLNQEVSPQGFFLSLLEIELKLPVCPKVHCNKRSLPGTDWKNNTNVIFPQGYRIHPRCHCYNFISKS